jgi:hypothetical protein
MKTWALSAMVIGTVSIMACGSSNGSSGTGGGGTGGNATTSSSSSSSTSSTSSSGTMDAVCSNPAALTQACLTCVTGLTSTQSCIKSFVTACEASSACVAYGNCQDACAAIGTGSGATGAGGGGTACVAGDANGDAGSPADNCLACCQGGNAAGTDAFFGDLITACACTAGAPCVSACM